jgi:uncharacterized membrane protein YdbT with pleckstrin-like domain
MVEKIRIKRSRLSFIGNYLLGIILLVFVVIANSILQPPLILVYFLLTIALMFFLEPEGIIMYTTYKLETNYVSESSGIFVKRQTAIPYRNITDERLKKGVVGRIFGFGDIIISGPKTEIKMKGIMRPEKVYEEIEKKLTRLHGERREINP